MVKPPQKPVVSSNLVEGFIHPPPFHEMPERNPMMKQPNTFTVMVPKGKAMRLHDCTILEIQYLRPPPKKLPMLTINTSFMSVSCLISVFVLYLGSCFVPVPTRSCGKVLPRHDDV